MFSPKKLILFMLLMGINGISFSMNISTVAKFSQRFRDTFKRDSMVDLCKFALILGSLKIVSDTYAMNLEANDAYFSPADKESQQFVKDALNNYGFPSAVINNIKIGKFDQFAALKSNLLVPFDAEKLAMAKYLANPTPALGSTLSYHKACDAHKSSLEGYTFEGAKDKNQFIDDITTIGVSVNLSTPIIESRGKYVSKDSLKYWQAAISHEMGHNMRSTTSPWRDACFCLIGLWSTRYGIFKFTQAINKFFLKSSSYNKFVSQKIGPDLQDAIVGLGQIPATGISFASAAMAYLFSKKYEEYRADTTMLRHVKEPETLRKFAEIANATQAIREYQLAKEHPKIATWFTKYPFLYEFFDIHPRGSLRAKRAIKRAEELEKGSIQQQNDKQN